MNGGVKRGRVDSGLSLWLCRWGLDEDAHGDSRHRRGKDESTEGVSGRREMHIRYHQLEITIKWNPFIHPVLHLPLMCQELRDQEEQEDRHRQR